MINFKFADIGEGIHEGVILKWHYEVGDEVEEGETMVVIETDKVNAEIPAPEDGVLKKRGAEVGETINVGDVLAVIDDGSKEDESAETSEKEPDDDSKEAQSDEEKSSDTSQKDDQETEEETASVVGSVEVSNDVLPDSNQHSAANKDKAKSKALATPVARKMAKDQGVDINMLKGSGPNGRVMKADIKKAASNKETSSKDQTHTATERPSMPSMPKEGIRREKISKLRQSIVKAMDTSNQLIPATTVMDEFDVTKLVNFRNDQKARIKEKGMKLTYLPLIIKAVILTMKEYPIFNASFDHETEEIVYKDFFNIGIAVDTEDGLIVPNIKNADQKSVLELAQEIDTLAHKARERKLKLEQLKNTTFSITNYGAFDAKLGTPIINHPELAILGMGAITKKPVVIDDEIKIRHMFPVSLTVDHRVIDGGDAGRFMVKLKAYLNDPMLLLLS